MTNRPRLLATLEGYAVEGGFDRPYEPATCYSPTIALGRHRGPGAADGLWTHYEEVLGLAAQLGLDGVRLTVEWARVEPHRGDVDRAALDRYARVVQHATTLGLHVTVALLDGVWPSWLGLEAWLLPWVVPHFIEHARRVGECVDAKGLVAFTQAPELVRGGYIDATLPPWRQGAAKDAQSARAQIGAIRSLLAHDAIIGARMVDDFVVVELDDDAPSTWRRVDASEVHVRSLVRGSGPTRSRAGLLARHDGAWSVAAASDVLEALR